MQTILGAGGAIGIPLAKALKSYTKDIRIVSRNPNRINETDELYPCDLTVADSVKRAVDGSEVVYLVAGFPYEYKVWRQVWPQVMADVIEACKQNGARIVFFDNVYMYANDQIPHMTEDSKIAPSSKKGKIRAEIADALMEADSKGDVKALIARSGDFYGPDNSGSLLMEAVIKPLMKGKKANWMVNANHIHNFTFTPDAGKATAFLGNTEEAYGEVWHVPTSDRKWTGKEWIEAIAQELDTKPKYREVSKTILKVMGWFDITMKESLEMMYQFDRDYFFDSSKIKERFGLEATPYEDGIKATVQFLKEEEEMPVAK